MTELVLEQGIKFDKGKPPVFRGVFDYFPRAILEVAKISEFGANKYAWGNWKNLEDGYNRYTDGLSRHLLLKSIEGLNDSESKMLHDAHAAWNALARLELYLISQQNKNNE